MDSKGLVSQMWAQTGYVVEEVIVFGASIANLSPFGSRQASHTPIQCSCLTRSPSKSFQPLPLPCFNENPPNGRNDGGQWCMTRLEMASIPTLRYDYPFSSGRNDPSSVFKNLLTLAKKGFA